ncbi:MAG: enoyl-ACP reductase FabI [Longimicrobiaceae bacterium]
MAKRKSLAGLLEGKRGLIVGVANRKSIAWSIARALAGAGMELAFTYQGEALRERVAKTTAELGEPPLFELDVRYDRHFSELFGDLSERWERLDFLLHSVAFAQRETFTEPFVQTRRQAFLTAHEISAYSLVGLVRAALPLMTEGGSVVTLSYHAAERVVPGYNLMGVAKASLEACVRYLASDLGPRNVRVNAISAGAVNTLAARGIPRFREMLKRTAEKAPLRRAIEVDEVGRAGLFLASELSSGVTGETLYVDAGANIMAL